MLFVAISDNGQVVQTVSIEGNCTFLFSPYYITDHNIYEFIYHVFILYNKN